MSLNFDDTRLPSPFFNSDHHAWREQVRRFVDNEIMPNIKQWEEEGILPDELWQQAAEIGLLQMGYPETYGGISEDIDIFFNIVAYEELARCGAGGVTATLMVHSIGLPPVVKYGSQAMKDKVVPQVLAGEKKIALAITEPSGGSDVANLQTTARREGDYYIVNGAKTFITAGMRADYFTTAVRTGDDGASGVSLLLIPGDLAGISRSQLKEKQGWWCSDTAIIYFDNVKVPVENIIGAENKGFAAIVGNFNSERLTLAAGAIAAARVCIEEAYLWAIERKTFGKQLSQHQVIGHKFAEMVRKVNASQAYMDNCAWQIQAGNARAADIALMKVQATQTMEFCAREAMQILGGMSFIRECRTERIYREVRVMAIGGGSEEIMRDLASRQMGL
ncbi:acyl-CoA dehydrogenase family protein [Thalassotalea psychrophila]|uniref:Acyl-CoA dehydrogenase family protein n=1 Tax=Thalassotalea psychrophila TaxID=3065647 RepID=A0ABY9U0B2_9GAMM|nr:acyl-CoA dehydrogenase family protein [Colwelliaceae bacterium SQ149]